jgi:hypothetical protein
VLDLDQVDEVVGDQDFALDDGEEDLNLDPPLSDAVDRVCAGSWVVWGRAVCTCTVNAAWLFGCGVARRVGQGDGSSGLVVLLQMRDPGAGQPLHRLDELVGGGDEGD